MSSARRAASSTFGPNIHWRSSGLRGPPPGSAAGLLGNNILGTDFSFNVEIRLAPELSCAAKRRPDRLGGGQARHSVASAAVPVRQGPVGPATMINNVESLANLSQIMLRGGKWFSEIGMGQVDGTKVFASRARSSTPVWSRSRWA